MVFYWSGWRGSNSLPPPWQGGALPDELHPHFLVPPVGIEPTTHGFSVRCSTNWATEAYEDFHPLTWRPGTGSNRRPLAWQASVLTNWTTGPCGGNNRARTCDPLLVRQMLSQLSYAPTSCRHYRDDLYTIQQKDFFVNTFFEIFLIFFKCFFRGRNALLFQCALLWW